MAPLRPNLREILGPGIHVFLSLLGSERQRGGLEAARPLVRVPLQGLLDGGFHPLEQFLVRCRRPIEIEELDVLIAGVVQPADEDGVRWNHKPALRQPIPHSAGH